MTERETTCPLCSKPLVDGKCDDCGYYIDDAVMANQTRAFFKERTTSSSHPQYYDQQRYNRNTYSSAPSQPDAQNSIGLRLACIVLTFLFGIWGFIVSVFLLKKSNDTKGIKIAGAILAFQIFAIFASIIINVFLEI